MSATGTGPTELAAFDAALVAAGVADRNLICLSSVLPPGAHVEQVPAIVHCPGVWGDRLYVVMARAVTATPGESAHAGIGWVQDDTRRGLLVEHHAGSAGVLDELIDLSLDALLKNRPRTDLPHRGRVTASATCHTGGQAVCALVVAVYESASWERRIPNWT